VRGSCPLSLPEPEPDPGLVVVVELVCELDEVWEPLEGVVCVGVVVVEFECFFGFEGVELPSGSWYCWSPALPPASAAAGTTSATIKTSAARRREGVTSPFVAEKRSFASRLPRPLGTGNRTERRVLVTGAAGFVGSNVALSLRDRHPEWEVVGLDNLRRRGSELNLPRLRERGVRFVHGDVRERPDLLDLERLDAIVECSAEPSALSGVDGATDYVVESNLIGAWNCLELARRDRAQVVFLSTSRVYPIDAVNSLAFEETSTRFSLIADQALPGASDHGISEAFPLAGARTLYGATKLSAELLIAEYASSFGIPATIDRCGVIAGPWQMGKVDQGVFTHWALSHHFGRALRYIGFGGSGKQVRDLMHVADLVELIDEQLGAPEAWAGVTVNVGGGADCSLSLLETTELCRELTGREVEILPDLEDRPGDVRIYVSDCRELFSRTSWRPQRGPREVMAEIVDWVRHNERVLQIAL
jgi:CDP-paratose 2-epimerase